MKHFLGLLLCGIGIMPWGGGIVRAQDPLFSQFFNSPVYLNPAFTGAGKYDFRATLSSRIQWMDLQTPYKYFSLSADKFLRDPNAGIGVTVNRFDEGYLSTTQAYVNLAKSFGTNENYCRDWYVNFAFQGGLGATNADRSKLVFPDQLDIGGSNGLPTQAELFKYAGRPYFDWSFGMVFSVAHFMFGAAGHHLNEPLNGLIGTADDSRLPRRLTVHMSYLNTLSDDGGEVLFRPTILYNLQGASRDLMVGGIIGFADGIVELNAWYKNNFGGTRKGLVPDYHSISIGVTIKLSKDKGVYGPDPDYRYNAGVNYEAELSRPGVRYTKGSSELGMLYEKNWNDENVCPKDPNRSGCAFYYPWTFF